MRRSMLASAAAAVLTIMAGPGNASAQSVEIYVGPGAPYEGYSYGYERPYRYGYGPRVYGYSSDDDTTIVRTAPRNRGGCGTYYYWNGDRCADARELEPRNRY